MEKFGLSYHVVKCLLKIPALDSKLDYKHLRYGKIVFYIDVLPKSALKCFENVLKVHGSNIKNALTK